MRPEWLFVEFVNVTVDFFRQYFQKVQDRFGQVHVYICLGDKLSSPVIDVIGFGFQLVEIVSVFILGDFVYRISGVLH